MSLKPVLRSSASKHDKTRNPSTISPASPITFTAVSTVVQDPVLLLSPGARLPGLKVNELNLLRQKQSQLLSTCQSTINSPDLTSTRRQALETTLIFAQHEAGTSVCITADGTLLTCAHCFGDTAEEYHNSNKRRWLLYYTGLAVQAECIIWDPKKDLALLKVIAIELPISTSRQMDVSNGVKSTLIPDFKFIQLAQKMPSLKTPLFCIGQPGRDDLESASAKKTKYNLVEISEGVFRGMVKGKDPIDNEEIGTLMHDVWTYWGHSGAPLCKESDGTLVGLHSSWDDTSGMRHGVPLVAVQEFLKETENKTKLPKS